MNWHIVASWAFGFFGPAVIIGSIVLGVSGAVGYVSLQDYFEISTKAAWSGVFLFAALAVLAGVIFGQFIK